MENRIPKEILEKVRHIEVRTNRLVNESLAGSYHSVFKGRGMNFDEVREYVPGDEIRSIDWNVTARTGSPHIKKFVEERELTIMLMIDISGSGKFGSNVGSKREMMAELGSVLAFSAVRNNDKVGLILFTDFIELFIPPQKGRTHILRVIREILAYQPERQATDLRLPLDFINRVVKRKCVAFLISDFCLNYEFDQYLEELARKLQITNTRHDLVSLAITDPREHVLPDVGWITIEDAETGEQVELNTADPKIRQGYQVIAADRMQKLKRTMHSSGVDLLNLSTDAPYLTPLLGFFQKRRRRMHQ